MRHRVKNRDLPPCVYLRSGSYFYVKRGKWINLGQDRGRALVEYARREAAPTDGVPGLIERWFADQEGRIAKSTRKTYAVAVRRLVKIFAEFEPNQVTARDVLAMQHHYRKTPAMANVMLNVMVCAFEFGFQENSVERNVARDVKPIPMKSRGRYITDQEYLAIHAKASPTMRAIMALAFYTGQRIGDVLAIRHADIQDDGIHFVQQKTKNRLVVSWTPELREAVAQAKALHKVVRGMHLVHSRKGTPLAYWTVRTLWARAVKAAGVEDVHIHDLRAKAATDAKKQGLDSQSLLGHKSALTTERYLRSTEIPVAVPASFRLSNSKG